MHILHDCPVAAVQNTEKNLYAVQFHPEVLHTKEGKTDAFQLCIQCMWMCR
ncbi:glutamine amidotransferase-related protein [Blautia stercoris]